MKKSIVKALLLSGVVSLSVSTITLSGYETDNTWYYQTEKEIQEKSFQNLPNGNYTLCITKPNYKPFIQKINAGMEYVQNELITGDVLYLVHDIKAGSHVTTIKPTGDVVIQSGASVTFEATGNVQLDKGFTCEKGAVLQIK